MTDDILHTYIRLNAGLESKVKALRAERVQLQSENEGLRREIAQMQDTVNHLQDEKGRFDEPPAAEWSDARVDAVAERIAKVEERFANVNAQFASRDKLRAEIHGRLDVLEKQVADIASELVDQHKDIERIDNRIDEPPAAEWSDQRVDAVAGRLTKVEDWVADIASELVDQRERLETSIGEAHGRFDSVHERITGVAATIGQRIVELHERLGINISGYETPKYEGKIESASITPPGHEPETGASPGFGRGDEVRLDMAQSQGGRRLFGWYVVEGLLADVSGFNVQVSPTEDRSVEPKRLSWIKAEDVLEVRKAAH